MLQSEVGAAFAHFEELYKDFRDALKNGRDDFDSVESNVKSSLKELQDHIDLFNHEQCEFVIKAAKFIYSPQTRHLTRRERSRSRSRRESCSSDSFSSSSSVLGNRTQAAEPIVYGLPAADGSGMSAVGEGSGAADTQSAADA